MTIDISNQVTTSQFIGGEEMNASDFTTPFGEIVTILNNLANGAQDVEAVRLAELGADPAAPPTGKWKLYTKSGGIYLMDDTGAVTGPLGTGGGGGASDAAEVTFTPAILANWDSNADPGDVNDALDQLAARLVAHTHDDRYYTEAETDALLTGKADTAHTHSASDVNTGTLAVERGGSGSNLSNQGPGYVIQGALGGSLFTRKANFTATTAPTANNDSDDGYNKGSFWFDTLADKAYICLDGTADAAVWKEITPSGGAGEGTVTSVGLSAPGELSVSGSPVTDAGTLGLSWANQAQNLVFASPDSSTGAPSFRSLLAADLPSHTHDPYQYTDILYVAQAGNDVNTGDTPESPKLTISAAITAASALTPGDSNRILVKVLDAATYTEDVTLAEYVSVDARGATLIGQITLSSDSFIYIDRHFAASNNQIMVNKSGGSGHGFYVANKQDGRGTAGTLTGVTGLRNISNGSVLFANVGVLFVSESGVGIADGAGGFGHIHFWSPDLYLGNSSIGISASSADTNIIGVIDHVLEIGAATLTTAIQVTNAGAIVKTTVSEIIADTAINLVAGSVHIQATKLNGDITVASDATLYANSPHHSGTITNNGTIEGMIGSVATAPGDLITRGANGLERLGIGAEGQVLSVSGGGLSWGDVVGGSGAPTDAAYIVQTPSAGLSAEQALSALGTGLLKNTTGTGVLSIATGSDVPDISATKITSGALSLARGGTGADASALGPGHWVQRGQGWGLSVIKDNFNAAVAPTPSDSAAIGGYAEGSLWFDTTNGKVYICLDDTASAAVWKEITAEASGAAKARDYYIFDEATDYTTTAVSFTDIDATKVKLDMTTSGGDILFGFNGNFQVNGTGSATVYINVTLDGVSVGDDDGMHFAYVVSGSPAADNFQAIGFTRLIPGVSAGVHEIILQWKVVGTTGIKLLCSNGVNLAMRPQLWGLEV